jgi:hypothetical protein
MLRFENVSNEQMPEVVRIASEMYERDRENERDSTTEIDEHESVASALEETGVPKEYLDRAAQELHIRRVEKVKQTRRKRIGIVATIAAAAALWGGWTLTHVPPPAPATIGISQSATVLESNPETQATVSYENVNGSQTAIIKISKFGLNRNGTYFANLNTTTEPRNLAGHKSVSFRVRGSGLPAVRLYLEAGASERWRSQPVEVRNEAQAYQLPLDSFDHQIRTNPTDQWRRIDYSAPGKIERFSFKLGTYVNDAKASGEVAISDLKVE